LKTRRFICLLIIMLILLANVSISHAFTPYHSYTYTYWGQPVPAPQAYVPVRSIDGKQLGVGSFNAPSHLFVDAKEDIYIVDSGNNRIVVVDKNWNVKNVIDEFGNWDTFDNPQGVFVTDEGSIYVADTNNNRIIELDNDGNLIREIGPPESDIIPEDFIYRPTKLVMDKAYRIYVVAQGVNQGVIELDGDGVFRGYMGAPRVVPNMVDYLWRYFSTREQRARMQVFIPTEYNNLYIDDEGFIYATTSALPQAQIEGAIASRSRTGDVAPVKRLNLTGDDVLRRTGFYPPVGEIRLAYYGSITGHSMLTDITVDENGIYSVLDIRRGRVFTYDPDGNLLFVFGGRGNQMGTFRSAVAIERLGNEIF
jgi:sugar lactone lactonase YvrE